MGKHVLILGGGVAGMSAAHELSERGFTVTVCERRAIPGGKARSVPDPGTGKAGRRELPGEHGFRFFPGFYRHLPDTMQRIPFAGQPNGVLGNLVEASRSEMAREGERPVIGPAHFPDSLEEFYLVFKDMFTSHLGIPIDETFYFIIRLLTLLSSCDERRFGEYEYESWWDFIGAATRSDNYKRYLAVGLSRSLVACRAEEISSRTGGLILAQLLFDMATPGMQVDRLLNGPTNEVWISPWLACLESRGVTYHTHAIAEQLHCDGSRITGVTVRHKETGATECLTADYYIAAFPVEAMQQLLTNELVQAAPSLAHIPLLRRAWMNGIQYYLKRDVKVVAGHTIYIDSPWALTSISQQQFWRTSIADTYGDGQVHGILSVDISNWDAPGKFVVTRPATHCTREEISREVWEQLKSHLNVPSKKPQLEDADLAGWFLDPDIREPRLNDPQPDALRNLEPLLINTKGSWEFRPTAALAIENLFVASDYVQTYTDLATMEGANEAARRAVNSILDASGSTATQCQLWKLSEPKIFKPLRELDKILYEAKKPHPLDHPLVSAGEHPDAVFHNLLSSLDLLQHPARTVLHGLMGSLRQLWHR